MSTVCGAQTAAYARSPQPGGPVATLQRWWVAYMVWRIERLAASRQSAMAKGISRSRSWEA
jgi:hypothetical protein